MLRQQPAHLPLKVVSLQFVQHCQTFVSGWPADDTLRLVDQIGSRSASGADCREGRPGCRAAVTPFAITGPHWMTEGRSALQTPWAERKLLFFGGHVPKPYLNSLRYELWSQLRRDPRATTESKTIGCSVGAYAACLHPDLQARTHAAAHAERLHHSSATGRARRARHGGLRARLRPEHRAAKVRPTLTPTPAPAPALTPT